jgi:hypothetical protein
VYIYIYISRQKGLTDYWEKKRDLLTIATYNERYN